MHLHFDGDLLIYRAGFAAEKMWYTITTPDGGNVKVQYKKDVAAWLEENGLAEEDVDIIAEREAEPFNNAWHLVRLMVDSTLDKLGVSRDDMTMYLSGPDNYRLGIATIKPYKGNRDEMHKPVHGPALKEMMRNHYGAVFSENEEADDIVGYSHYAMWCEDPLSSVIVSVDKDLDMIPGLHYNFVTEASYYMEPDEADRCFLRQLLTGDATDNIPGIPGVGPVKAEKLLASADDPWEVIEQSYREAYGELWYSALLENGRLLWIRREPHEFWLPPEYVLDDHIPYYEKEIPYESSSESH